MAMRETGQRNLKVRQAFNGWMGDVTHAHASLVTPYKENEAKPYVKSVFLAKMTCANASPTLHNLGETKNENDEKNLRHLSLFRPGAWVLGFGQLG